VAVASGRLYVGQGSVWGGAVGRNPTDRGKKGSKKSLLTDGAGGPLAVVVAAANVPDDQLLRQTLEAMVVECPRPSRCVAGLHLSLENTFMTQIILERSALPDTGPIAIQVNHAGEIKVKPRLLGEKSMFICSYAGREPGLVLGERLVWRFPAMLAMPSYGEIDPINTIDVDAATGDILSLPPHFSNAGTRQCPCSPSHT